MNIFKKNIKNRTKKNKNIEEIHFCCLKGEFLFHDTTELGRFSNENDFFSIYDVL